MNLEDILKSYQQRPQFENVHLVSPNQKGFDEDTPFHMACFADRLDEVLIMLSAGADVNLKGDLGMTALHMAALHNSLVLVKHLLEAGADRNITNEDGHTPADLAEIMDFVELAEMIDNWPASRDLFPN